MSKTSEALIVVLAALGLVVIVVVVAGVMHVSNLTTGIWLPFVGIAGVVLLLVALALVSVAFGTFGLSDKSQALALPEGSIRAVIALSIVVLFAILSIFLYDRLASGVPITKLDPMSEAVKNKFINSNPNLQNMVVTPVVHKNDKGEDEYVYTITYGTPHNPQSDDFAKQLLVMIGTLLTSMAAFYFGAKTAAAAAQTQDKTTLAPNARGIEPNQYQLQNSNPIPLKVRGDNLNSIKHVKIILGNNQIEGTDVVSNDSLVTCNIPVTTNPPPGQWDVIVIDGSSKSSKLEKALEIKAVAQP